MSNYLTGLNAEQQTAVLAVDGPILVLAGAGSGKTSVLTRRLAHLIATGNAKPSELLAVTFTNKAAKEMRARVGSLVGEKHTSQLSMGTFHGLGARILREQHRYAPRSAGFSILDTNDSERLLREACKTLGINTQQISPRGVRNIISKAKSTQTSPEELARQAQSPVSEAAASVYPLYEQLLAAHDSYDFDDLIIAPLQILVENETVRRSYQARWRFISVDEYQDTNPPQDALLKLLLGPERNLCAVGDDYQAIYSWRGARVDHILKFETHFPTCTTIYLTQNYRSTTPILEAANQIIAVNEEQKHKELWTTVAQGIPVEVVGTSTERAEAAIVRAGMAQALTQGVPASECAVLYRTNAQSRAIEEELLLHNMPYQIIGGTRFYDRAEIKDALALLQLAIQPHSALSLERIVRTLVPGVGAKTLQRIRAHAIEQNIALITAVQDEKILTSRLQASFTPVLRAIARASALPAGTVADMLDTLLQESGYYRYLKEGDRAQERLENIAELQNVAVNHSDPVKFIEDIVLMSDIDEAHGVDDRVLCMTLHAAKGLEFERVWVVGCEEGLLPHRNTLINPAELAEERRLLYVGMTRAKQQLTLTYAKTRTLHGESSPQVPSRFLKDLPESVAHITTGGQVSGQSVTENTTDGTWDIDGHDIGELVSHPHFGQGVIIQISGSLVTCVFEGHGVKTLDAALTN